MTLLSLLVHPGLILSHAVWSSSRPILKKRWRRASNSKKVRIIGLLIIYLTESDFCTVHWFVNAKLESRLEKAKELLAERGIPTDERTMFHGTAAQNIQPILQVRLCDLFC